MKRPRSLDLFCGAGGVSVGLQRAGFDVVGVDIRPIPCHRGGEFVKADALTYPLEGFDFIWASPPCQRYSSLAALQKGKEYPDLIPATRERLIASGIPYCIENVPGAPLAGFLTMLCGTMFGLQTPDGRAEIRRHRLFETSFSIALRPACDHQARSLSVSGANPEAKVPGVWKTYPTKEERKAGREVISVDDARYAMGIDWMPMKYLSQAIPPAYAEWIGRQALEVIQG